MIVRPHNIDSISFSQGQPYVLQVLSFMSNFSRSMDFSLFFLYLMTNINFMVNNRYMQIQIIFFGGLNYLEGDLAGIQSRGWTHEESNARRLIVSIFKTVQFGESFPCNNHSISRCTQGLKVCYIKLFYKVHVVISVGFIVKYLESDMVSDPDSIEVSIAIKYMWYLIR